MTAQEYEILKARVEKGRAYLKKEYWVAYEGKGRRDAEMLRIVDIWFKMLDEVIQYEKQQKQQS